MVPGNPIGEPAVITAQTVVAFRRASAYKLIRQLGCQAADQYPFPRATAATQERIQARVRAAQDLGSVVLYRYSAVCAVRPFRNGTLVLSDVYTLPIVSTLHYIATRL